MAPFRSLRCSLLLHRPMIVCNLVRVVKGPQKCNKWSLPSCRAPPIRLISPPRSVCTSFPRQISFPPFKEPVADLMLLPFLSPSRFPARCAFFAPSTPPPLCVAIPQKLRSPAPPNHLFPSNNGLLFPNLVFRKQQFFLIFPHLARKQKRPSPSWRLTPRLPVFSTSFFFTDPWFALLFSTGLYYAVLFPAVRCSAPPEFNEFFSPEAPLTRSSLIEELLPFPPAYIFRLLPTGAHRGSPVPPLNRKRFVLLGMHHWPPVFSSASTWNSKPPTLFLSATTHPLTGTPPFHPLPPRRICLFNCTVLVPLS